MCISRTVSWMEQPSSCFNCFNTHTHTHLSPPRGSEGVQPWHCPKTWGAAVFLRQRAGVTLLTLLPISCLGLPTSPVLVFRLCTKQFILSYLKGYWTTTPTPPSVSSPWSCLDCTEKNQEIKTTREGERERERAAATQNALSSDWVTLVRSCITRHLLESGSRRPKSGATG